MKKQALALFLALALCLGLAAPALAAELPKLPTPTDLRWGVDEFDEEIPGMVSWTMGHYLDEIAIYYYNVKDDTTAVIEWEISEIETLPKERWSDIGFIVETSEMELESGDYYFTVQLKGDGATYADSEIARSSTWSYTKPSAKLPTPSAPVVLPEGTIPEVWEGMRDDIVAIFSWDGAADSGYIIDYYFSATNANATDVATLMQVGGVMDIYSYTDQTDALTSNTTNLDEAGYYYARVRALSRDITQIQNSDWSPLSAAYYYAGNGETPTSPTPSITPSTQPSTSPSTQPSTSPSTKPSTTPSPTPSTTPSAKPSAAPSTKPSTQPSTTPSTAPSTQPSAAPVAVTGVELSRSKVSLKENETTVLTATVKPTNAANKGVYWTSSDTAVLSVSDTGKVTARKAGTATVTVTTLDGSFTAACTVTVTKAPSTVGGGGGGSSSGGSLGGGGGGATTPSAAPSAQPSAQPSAKPIDTSKPASENFSDVVKDSWYEAGVTYVVQKGLFQGVADRTFAPQQDMTRAMLMTVLARLDGQDTQGGDAWYSKGMDWAVANGISDGTLPDSSVTREQLVTMLYRYAKATAAEGALTAYVDGNSVSPWARAAVTWAVKQGILTGKDGARLDPQGTATRAEVATIFQRFTEKK